MSHWVLRMGMAVERALSMQPWPRRVASADRRTRPLDLGQIQALDHPRGVQRGVFKRAMKANSSPKASARDMACMLSRGLSFAALAVPAAAAVAG